MCYQLDLGANEYGLNGALPTDPMHAWTEGVLKYIVKIFFRDILKPQGCASIDRMANEFIKNGVPRQSGRTLYPRVSFSGGLSKTTNLAAHEYNGICLVLALLLHDPRCHEILADKISKKGRRIEEYRDFFERDS